jgi:hypothetical protein
MERDNKDSASQDRCSGIRYVPESEAFHEVDWPEEKRT